MTDSTETSPVTVEIDGGIRVITLNRPHVKNALSEELLAQLCTALRAAQDDDTVRAIVLTGAENTFCAGADISRFAALQAEPTVAPPSGSSTEAWQVLRETRKPVIAAVEGAAFGGGCELALACDFIVAARGSRFALPEVGLGAIPAAGGTQRVITALGKAKAMRLLLVGDPISGEEAERAGMVSDVVQAGMAVITARDLAERIARNSPLAVALAKDAALASLDSPLEIGTAFERRNAAVAFSSDDITEGQAAFLEKRAPRFTGQ